MTAPTGIDLEALIELAAERMRADYVSTHKPNLKQWSEIDDGMRAVWRQHARAAAEIYETAFAASQAEQIAGMAKALELAHANMQYRMTFTLDNKWCCDFCRAPLGTSLPSTVRDGLTIGHTAECTVSIIRAAKAAYDATQRKPPQ